MQKLRIKEVSAIVVTIPVKTGNVKNIQASVLPRAPPPGAGYAVVLLFYEARTASVPAREQKPRCLPPETPRPRDASF
jgi:hypothetical protein